MVITRVSNFSQDRRSAHAGEGLQQSCAGLRNTALDQYAAVSRPVSSQTQFVFGMIRSLLMNHAQFNISLAQSEGRSLQRENNDLQFSTHLLSQIQRTVEQGGSVQEALCALSSRQREWLFHKLALTVGERGFWGSLEERADPIEHLLELESTRNFDQKVYALMCELRDQGAESAILLPSLREGIEILRSLRSLSLTQNKWSDFSTSLVDRLALRDFNSNLLTAKFLGQLLENIAIGSIAGMCVATLPNVGIGRLWVLRGAVTSLLSVSMRWGHEFVDRSIRGRNLRPREELGKMALKELIDNFVGDLATCWMGPLRGMKFFFEPLLNNAATELLSRTLGASHCLGSLYEERETSFWTDFSLSMMNHGLMIGARSFSHHVYERAIQSGKMSKQQVLEKAGATALGYVATPLGINLLPHSFLQVSAAVAMTMRLGPEKGKKVSAVRDVQFLNYSTVFQKHADQLRFDLLTGHYTGDRTLLHYDPAMGFVPWHPSLSPRPIIFQVYADRKWHLELSFQDEKVIPLELQRYFELRFSVTPCPALKADKNVHNVWMHAFNSKETIESHLDKLTDVDSLSPSLAEGIYYFNLFCMPGHCLHAAIEKHLVILMKHPVTRIMAMRILIRRMFSDAMTEAEALDIVQQAAVQEPEAWISVVVNLKDRLSCLDRRYHPLLFLSEVEEMNTRDFLVSRCLAWEGEYIRDKIHQLPSKAAADYMSVAYLEIYQMASLLGAGNSVAANVLMNLRDRFIWSRESIDAFTGVCQLRTFYKGKKDCFSWDDPYEPRIYDALNRGKNNDLIPMFLGKAIPDNFGKRELGFSNNASRILFFLGADTEFGRQLRKRALLPDCFYVDVLRRVREVAPNLPVEEREVFNDFLKNYVAHITQKTRLSGKDLFQIVVLLKSFKDSSLDRPDLLLAFCNHLLNDRKDDVEPNLNHIAIPQVEYHVWDNWYGNYSQMGPHPNAANIMRNQAKFESERKSLTEEMRAIAGSLLMAERDQMLSLEGDDLGFVPALSALDAAKKSLMKLSDSSPFAHDVSRAFLRLLYESF